MESNAMYTTSDAGLNRFFGKIYGLVGIGVGISAVISYLMLFPLSHLFVNILMNYSWVYTAAIFVELALVFLASGAARKNTPAALPLYNLIRLHLHHLLLCGTLFLLLIISILS